jgi:hypothetical protein
MALLDQFHSYESIAFHPGVPQPDGFPNMFLEIESNCPLILTRQEAVPKNVPLLKREFDCPLIRS